MTNRTPASIWREGYDLGHQHATTLGDYVPERNPHLGAPSTAVVEVDAVRSHITITADPPGRCDGAFVDLGPVLHWWSHRALELDPTGARQLAAGLIDWADRRDPPAPTGGPT